jgi:ABC-2 type transport system ATP-binding protein
MMRDMYPDWNEERMRDLADAFGIDINKKLMRFSKGMQKQAAMTLALSVMPQWLILDEPIDGLDPVARRVAWKCIIDDVALRNTTVLISSHNLREMEGYCDYIGIISEGKMIIERELEDLKSDVHKVQIAYKNDRDESLEGLNILHKEIRGSVELLIIRDSREKIESVIGRKEPAVFDMLPLTLEEIFIYEIGGENDEIRGII